MKILALDTSNRALSVAVVVDDDVLAETTLNRKKAHSEQLLPTIKHLLEFSALQPQDLDRVVVADGPGSYTGVRIAVTTAKTLAFTLNLELVGISSLAAMAASVVHTHSLIAPLIDARRGNVFAGAYQWDDAGELVNVIADKHLALADFMKQLAVLKQPVIFTAENLGSLQAAIEEGLGAQAHFADPITCLPRASRLAFLGKKAQPVSAITMVPRYLRLTEAETNWLKTHKGERHAPYVEKV